MINYVELTEKKKKYLVARTRTLPVPLIGPQNKFSQKSNIITKRVFESFILQSYFPNISEQYSCGKN